MVAIAVPIFNGALDKAREATFTANQRSIKAAGVAIILTSKNYDADSTGPWYAYATVDTNGDIGEVNVSDSDGNGESKYSDWKSDTTQAIEVKITATTLNEYTSTP